MLMREDFEPAAGEVRWYAEYPTCEGGYPKISILLSWRPNIGNCGAQRIGWGSDILSLGKVLATHIGRELSIG